MSMVNPSIDYLTEQVDSKYTLVIMAAKRARELTENKEKQPLIQTKSNKPVTIALEEVGKGVLGYERK